MYVMIRVALNDKEMLESSETIPERVRRQVGQGLRIQLVPQGITGLSFVEAEYYPGTDAAPLEIDWDPKYTYIPSTPSVMNLLSRTIERMTAELSTLDLKAIGNNVESATSNLNLTVEHVEQIARAAADSSDEVISDVKTAVSELPSITSNLNAAVIRLDSMVGDSDHNIEQILNNLRLITDDTRELIRMIRRYPGMLLTEPPDQNLSK
jgi:methyl-accepting chemotaxis protein